MIYNTDCNFIVKPIGKEQIFECYTKEQVKSHLYQKNGCLVYKIKKRWKPCPPIWKR